MKHIYKTFFFIVFLMVALVPATTYAQYTITSLGDLGAWDDPDTDEDESMDGICDDGSGQCTLRAALEEASNRETSVSVIFGISGTLSTAQNLPNPFNSSTNIQYELGSRQFVQLKIYDLLGKEVAILVNEEKPAGNYEIKFDASSLKSGTYFYKHQAGKFAETKKMILLR